MSQSGIKKNYSSWHAPETFSSQRELTELCIQYAVLAPSVHNAQPWRFEVLSDGSVNLKVKTNKKLSSSDPKGHYALISLGAALENYSQAAEAFGFTPKIIYKTENDEPSIFINIILDKKNKVIDVQKLRVIKKRYSEKRMGEEPKILSTDLKKHVVSGGRLTKTYITDDKKLISRLAKTYYSAAKSYNTDKHFARELSSWLRKSNTKKHDGMTAKSSDIPDKKALVGKIVLKITPKILGPMSEKYLHMVSTSDAVGCISSKEENPKSLILVGRELERISLLMTKNGYSLTALAAIIERKSAKETLKKDLGVEGLPQIFFRVVRARDNHPKAPRYQVKSLIKRIV